MPSCILHVHFQTFMGKKRTVNHKLVGWLLALLLFFWKNDKRKLFRSTTMNNKKLNLLFKTIRKKEDNQRDVSQQPFCVRLRLSMTFRRIRWSADCASVSQNHRSVFWARRWREKSRTANALCLVRFGRNSTRRRRPCTENAVRGGFVDDALLRNYYGVCPYHGVVIVGGTTRRWKRTGVTNERVSAGDRGEDDTKKKNTEKLPDVTIHLSTCPDRAAVDVPRRDWRVPVSRPLLKNTPWRENE